MLHGEQTGPHKILFLLPHLRTMSYLKFLFAAYCMTHSNLKHSQCYKWNTASVTNETQPVVQTETQPVLQTYLVYILPRACHNGSTYISSLKHSVCVRTTTTSFHSAQMWFGRVSKATLKMCFTICKGSKTDGNARRTGRRIKTEVKFGTWYLRE
jgi:hypothetical protein